MNTDFSPIEKATVRAFAQTKANGNYRTTCPACSVSRRNAKAQCLSVTVFPDRVVYDCHHCEAKGATYLHDDLRKPFQPPQMEKPKKAALKRLDVGLTQDAIDFLSERKITLPTAQTFGLISSRAWFRDLDGGREGEAIAFPYLVNGKVHGHKVRCIEQKEMVCDTALSSLFGIQNVDLKECGDLLICEGEFDPLAFYEAGVCNATSVPNGSSSFNRSNDDGTMKAQLGFLWEARDIIDKAKRILIAVDSDEAGQKLADELARRIGRHRCWRVLWPEGCKDANDVLLAHGGPALADCAAKAEPWPVEGLYEAMQYFDDYDDLFENGFGERINTGLAEVDEIFSVAPGLLTVVTGNPNAGKSNFVNQIVLNLARQYGHVTAMCSFETPPAVHLGQLTEMLVQKHFFETLAPGIRMTKAEKDGVKDFLNRHIKFFHQDDGAKATVESIVERIKTAVFRWGAKVVVIDPYSYIHRPPGMESETAFIADMLTRIRLAAKTYGVHVFFIAHPSKPQVNADGTTSVPKGYSISGSAAWFNHPDHGLSVHRKEDGEVEIHCWKTRFSWLGKNGMATIWFDPMRHCYVSSNWDSMVPFEGRAA